MSKLSDDETSELEADRAGWSDEIVRARTGAEARPVRRYDIPRKTVVQSIAPERTGPIAGLDLPLAEQWAILTKPLELAGRESMRPLVGGGMGLTQRIGAAMPWLTDVIRSVEQQLAATLAAGRPWLAFRPMLLVGPPGSGKSHLARQLATLAGCGSGVLDVGGTSDNRNLEGTARGYSNAQPCWPLTVIAQTRTANPVLVIDELDKAGGSDRNGDIRATLLSMLEPSTARGWLDSCLMAPADLSAVNWVFTSNRIDRLPGTLLSRLDVHHVGLPASEHFDGILAGLLQSIAGELQLRPQDVPELPLQVRQLLQKRFDQDRSVRLLARHARGLVGALLADAGGPQRQ